MVPTLYRYLSKFRGSLRLTLGGMTALASLVLIELTNRSLRGYRLNLNMTGKRVLVIGLGPVNRPKAGTFSRRIIQCGQLVTQFLRGQLEELPEAQVGRL